MPTNPGLYDVGKRVLAVAAEKAGIPNARLLIGLGIVEDNAAKLQMRIENLAFHGYDFGQEEERSSHFVDVRERFEANLDYVQKVNWSGAHMDPKGSWVKDGKGLVDGEEVIGWYVVELPFGRSSLREEVDLVKLLVGAEF